MFELPFFVNVSQTQLGITYETFSTPIFLSHILGDTIVCDQKDELLMLQMSIETER